ncbi:MAG TPA: short-chain fatty acyl-CoA regulator family protein [Polyangiales bacterium]
MSKAFMGSRLRRLREERGLTQAALAAKLQISASYLNQLEHNQRPLTVAVLPRISAALDVDEHYFSDEDEAQLLAALRDVVAVLPQERAPSPAALRALASDLPEVGQALVTLHRRYREAVERAEVLASRISDRTARPALAPTPYEEVRDFFCSRNNYVGALEDAAEQLVREAALIPGDMSQGLAERLEGKHGVRIVVGDDPIDLCQRRYDAERRTLRLPHDLRPGQRAFRVATQLAFLEHGSLLSELARAAPQLTSDEARALTRIGLANYFAGAVLCPYVPFLERARELRYDIDRLGAAFAVGFETTCHRLSTLQRPDARGVPFFLIRVDRAGNISKRQSASDFHFSRVGGTCPLWNVYEAFAQPGRTLRQLAQMPDGRTYLWIARTVSSQRSAYRAPLKEFAVGLGCDARHAHELVYAEGLDASTPTPIGAGCKVCERQGCAQRAFPPIGRTLAIDENESRFAPYPVT